MNKSKLFLNRAILLLILFCHFQFQACTQNDSDGATKIYSRIPNERIDYADSLFILYTIKEWGKINWWTFQDYSRMYEMKNKDVDYFINRVFYNPEKIKVIIWYGEKIYNANTITAYSNDSKKNRICPTGGDTVYFMNVLIGFRDSLNHIWNLYPFNNQSVTCSPSKEKAIKILEQYYFNKMNAHEMLTVIQGGENRGELELKAYNYNITDKDFWDKCWLWERDSIGSYGLYPFQVKRYNGITGEKCTNCAEPFDIPKIDYPNELIQLFISN